jgi:branched-chain amino acid transport system substrate-binding protein
MQIVNRSLLIGAMAVALGAAGPAHAENVKIGFLGGFTGPIESLTPPIFDAAKLAVAEVNEQGGILGGKLEIIPGDSTCTDATAAANAADKEVNSEHVTAIVGGLCSGETISAANNAAIPGNVVMISPASTSPAITTLKDNDLVFRTPPSDAYQGEVLARLLITKGIKNIGITYVNNDYGKGFADALATAYKSDGGTVAADVAHEDGKADYRAELGQIASAGVQNLVILAYANGSGQTILRQAIESGDFTTYIGGDGMVGDALFTGIDKKAVEGMIATKPGESATPGTPIYQKLATAAGLKANAVYAPQSYDAAFALALAIEKNGSAKREGLSKALREVTSGSGETIYPGEWKKAVDLIKAGKGVNYDGASGSLDFDKNGDVPGTIVQMTVKDGKFIEVGTAKP